MSLQNTNELDEDTVKYQIRNLEIASMSERQLRIALLAINAGKDIVEAMEIAKSYSR